MTARLLVVIPTVEGREEDLAKTVAAYEADPRCTVHATYGHGQVGAGWDRGLHEWLDATGDTHPEPTHVLFGNDDMWPHAGYLDPALEASDRGYTPCPYMWRPDGTLESGGEWQKPNPDWHVVHWSPLPFFRFDERGPHLDGFPPIHYWSDNWLAVSAQYRLNRPVVVRRDFAFTHTWAMPGRQYLEDPAARAAGKLFQAFERDCKAAWKRGEYPLLNRDFIPHL